MSLLNVPSTPFPPHFIIIYSLTDTAYCFSHVADGNQIKPLCNSAPSVHLADPIQNTGYEPKICIDVGSEHTPINLPSRNMSVRQKYDATITASEDLIYLDIPEHQAAAIILQQAEFPTLLKRGLLGTSLTKVLADYDSVAIRQRNLCGHGSRDSCFKSFRVCVRGEERLSTTLCKH